MLTQPILLTPARALPLEFYERPATDVARDLLGVILIHQTDDETFAGIIVETEAYADSSDPASHASVRRNGLVRAMWGPGGTAYVYSAFGVYPCFNVVTGEEGTPSAVLVRAVEPLTVENDTAYRLPEVRSEVHCSGPGRLARHFQISTTFNTHPLHTPPLWLQCGIETGKIVIGPRVGVRKGLDRLWRFAVAAHPAVSRPRL